jgi:hypothetical protein
VYFHFLLKEKAEEPSTGPNQASATTENYSNPSSRKLQTEKALANLDMFQLLIAKWDNEQIERQRDG